MRHKKDKNGQHDLISGSNDNNSYSKETEKISRITQLESELFNDMAFNLLPNIKEAVIVVDKDNHIVYLNKVAEKLVQYPLKSIEGKKLTAFIHLYDVSSQAEFLVPKIDKEEMHRQGKLIYDDMILEISSFCRKRITLSVLPFANPGKQGNEGYVLLIDDNTLYHKMEDELIKAYKFTSTRLFIGGIAHDFNNILTSVLGHVSLVRHCISNNIDIKEKLFEKLQIAEKACEKAHRLSNQLLEYTKEGSPQKELCSVEAILRETVGFVSHGSNVKYRFDFAGDIPQVDIDVSQISQVVNNIVINAIQSMPDGGVVTISAGKASVDADSSSGLAEGKYLKLSISDTGQGIPREYAAKVFDPFFTAKENGTGLGLTSCKKIVEAHKGRITFNSEEGKGTTFHIYLPVAENIPLPREETGQHISENISAGYGKILIMDDDPEVKEVFAGILEMIGCEIDFAANEDEIAALYSKSITKGCKYQTVILDLVVPGWKGGIEAINKLLAIDKDVNAILTSGSSKEKWNAKYKEFGFKAFLTKPFSIQSLVRAIEEANR